MIVAFLAVAGAVAFILTFRQPEAQWRPDTDLPAPAADNGPRDRDDGLAETGLMGDGSHACAGNRDPIPFKRLSSEKEFPFIFQGRPIPDDWPDQNKYIASISRFPDVKSCLMDAEADKEVPNLTLFDWDKITGKQDAAVCLFRIFSSIGNVDLSRQWLTSQGFELGLAREIPSVIMRGHGKSEAKPGTGIDASWSIKNCGEKFRGSSLVLAYALSIGAIFTADDAVDTISVTYNTL